MIPTIFAQIGKLVFQILVSTPGLVKAPGCFEESPCRGGIRSPCLLHILGSPNVTENNGLRGVQIVNEIGTNAIISLNEAAE